MSPNGVSSGWPKTHQRSSVVTRARGEGSAENFTLTASRLLEGKFSVRSGTSQIETVILADRVLELRMRGELIHCLRKRKMTDAYSRLEDLGRTARLADDI